MRKLFFIFLALIPLSIIGQSCDKLTLVSGSEIESVVEEIRLDEIAYRKCDNPLGPLYVIKKTDLFMITFKNGTKEIIKNNVQLEPKQVINRTSEDIKNQNFITGLQVTFGPNYTLTKSKNTTYEGIDYFGRPVITNIDPSGSFGGYLEIGLAHCFAKETKLFHRLDWGIGFDYIGGKEKTNVEIYTTMNELIISSDDFIGSFYNAYLTARFTADHFTKLGDKWNLETGIGFNFNYNIKSSFKSPYIYGYGAQVVSKFQKNFMAQIHAHLGLNYQIGKDDNLTFGFFAPMLGIYEMNKLKPTIQWFSSNYYPLHPQIKWIHFLN